MWLVGFPLLIIVWLIGLHHSYGEDLCFCKSSFGVGGCNFDVLLLRVPWLFWHTFSDLDLLFKVTDPFEGQILKISNQFISKARQDVSLGWIYLLSVSNVLSPCTKNSKFQVGVKGFLPLLLKSGWRTEFGEPQLTQTYWGCHLLAYGTIQCRWKYGSDTPKAYWDMGV